MYWDNNRIADYYAANNYRAEVKFDEIRRSYINDLIIVDAIFVPDRRAFINRDFNEDYTDSAVYAMNEVDHAVWEANKTLNSDMDIDEDLTLSMIETDSYIRVVGCTTDRGMDLLENALIDCKKFGAVEIIFK